MSTSKTCKYCGELCSVTAQYCRQCGHRFEDDKAPTLNQRDIEARKNKVPALAKPEKHQDVVSCAETAIHGTYTDTEKALKKLATLEHREEAIPLFVDHFHKSGDTYGMSKALAAVGKISAVEPLLEIFRTVKPSKIQEGGFIREEDKGEDGPPASAIVSIPRAIAQLKAICSPDEFERILVTAHNYSFSNSFELIRAFGEIATPKTIGRLLSALRQQLLPAEMHTPIKEALINAGGNAHAQLLLVLETDFSPNRRYQTTLRRDVLDVLKETGDEYCVRPVKTVMESDPAVAAEARATIEAISKRHKGIEVPDIIEGKPLPLKTVAKSGDAYIDACFQIEFQEFDEIRSWKDIARLPEGKAMAELHAGRIQEALRLTGLLRDKYPDFYLPYDWFAEIYSRQRRYDDARNALLEGLRRAKSKHNLCGEMGYIEWGSGNLPEAVKWWIRSIVLQVSTKNIDDSLSFLYLSYVAEQSRLKSICSKLRYYADKASTTPGGIRLNTAEANKMYAATRGQGTESMKRAIDILNKEYLS